MSRAAICPPSRRGHTWREPEPALLPEVARRDLAALRVCLRCGEFGRVNSQGVVTPTRSPKHPETP